MKSSRGMFLGADRPQLYYTHLSPSLSFTSSRLGCPPTHKKLHPPPPQPGTARAATPFASPQRAPKKASTTTKISNQRANSFTSQKNRHNDNNFRLTQQNAFTARSCASSTQPLHVNAESRLTNSVHAAGLEQPRPAGVGALWCHRSSTERSSRSS